MFMASLALRPQLVGAALMLGGGYTLSAAGPVMLGSIPDIAGSFSLSMWLIVAINVVLLGIVLLNSQNRLRRRPRGRTATEVANSRSRSTERLAQSASGPRARARERPCSARRRERRDRSGPRARQAAGSAAATLGRRSPGVPRRPPPGAQSAIPEPATGQDPDPRGRPPGVFRSRWMRDVSA